MRALVTGATGFVGGALAKKLCAEGAELRVLVRSRAGEEPWMRAGVDVRVAGLEDPNPIAEAAQGCDVVFHCAGERASHASERALAWVNVAGTENVLRATRYCRVPRLVHLSSADVTLTGADRLGWKEDVVLTDHPLGAALRTERLAEELALQASGEKTQVVAVRPAWIWGPGDRGELPMLIEEARSGGIRLFGRGDALFATAYVDNVVDALLAAARAEGVGGKAYHVADAETLTAREFFTQLSETLALPAPRAGFYLVEYPLAWLRERRGSEGPWPVDVARRARACLLDCGRASSGLGYSARVSVDDGMRALAAWVREQGGPDAVRRLARSAQTDADADAYERAANALAGRDS